MPSLYLDATQELARARTLFPSNEHIVLAFAEEAGEVVKAVLDHKQGKASIADVRKEIVQTMSMLLRIAEEGDPTVGLPPTDPNRYRGRATP